MRRPVLFSPPVFSILTKVIGAFLVILAPLYAINFAFLARSQGVLTEELYASMRSRVGFYADLLDNELDRILRQQRGIANDLNVVFLSVASEAMSTYERFVAVRTLEDRLSDIRESSKYISDVVAYIPSLQYRISGDYHLTSIPAEELDAMAAHAADQTLFTWNGELYSVTAYPTGATGLGRPSLLVAVRYSQAELRRLLSQLTPRVGPTTKGGAGEAAAFGPGFRWYVGDIQQADARQVLGELSAPQGLSPTVAIAHVSVRGLPYVASYARNPLLGSFVLSLAPESLLLAPLAIYRSWILLQIGASGVIIALFSYWLFRLVHRPLQRLVLGFRALEKGDFQHSMAYTRRDEFGYLYRRFNGMTERLRELVQVVYEQKYRLSVSELRELQSQIKPHFLSNCFFTLYRLAKQEGSEATARLSQLLGSYFKYTSLTDRDVVDLASEVEHSRTYVEIQAVRFGDRISAAFAPLPERARGLQVPRLIVQPIIENAYRHGLEDLASGGVLSVDFAEQDGMLLISIEDNGKGLPDGEIEALRNRLEQPDPASDGIGLPNVHRRLRMRFGAASGVTLARGGQGGLRVQLAIPTAQGG